MVTAVFLCCSHDDDDYDAAESSVADRVAAQRVEHGEAADAEAADAPPQPRRLQSFPRHFLREGGQHDRGLRTQIRGSAGTAAHDAAASTSAGRAQHRKQCSARSGSGYHAVAGSSASGSVLGDQCQACPGSG